MIYPRVVRKEQKVPYQIHHRWFDGKTGKLINEDWGAPGTLEEARQALAENLPCVGQRRELTTDEQHLYDRDGQLVGIDTIEVAIPGR